MLQHDTPEDFVIATGVQHTVREVPTLAFAHEGIEVGGAGAGEVRGVCAGRHGGGRAETLGAGARGGPHGGGGGGAHKVRARLCVPAVPLHHEAVDAVIRAVEGYGGHGRLPQALTLVISTLV